MKISTCTICDLSIGNEEFYLDLMIKSAQQFADEIIIVLNESKKPKTTNDKICSLKNKDFIKKYNMDSKVKIYNCDYQEDFSKGRQMAHDKATGDWLFWLDADEVIHEKQAEGLKELLEKIDNTGAECIDVQYLHFYNDFAHIDSSEPIHYGIYRIYKNLPGIQWTRQTHSFPIKTDGKGNLLKVGRYGFKTVVMPQILIYHLGYLRGIEKIYQRFERNYRIGSFHNPYHQVHWRDWHYYGDYPRKKIDIRNIPKVIKDTFMMGVYDK